MNDEMYEEVDGDIMRMAYIRQVAKAEVADAPDDAPETLYALHDADGRPLAVFSSHDNAVLTARTHNFEPVMVH